jgi:nucleoside phosphorylase
MNNKYESLKYEDITQEIKSSIIFLLVTVTDIEMEKLHEQLSPISDNNKIIKISYNSHTYYIGKFGLYNIVHVNCNNMGSTGRGASIITINDSLNNWENVEAVIMIGIAYGVDKARQKIGDVLISKNIIPYDKYKIKNGVKEERGEIFTSGQILFDRFKNITDCSQIKCHIGDIASGEILINDEEFRNAITKRFPNTIGGEMEGTGLASASESKRKEWILIKGICDFADGNKDNNKDNNQIIAARNAVMLCKRVFSENVFNEFFKETNNQDILPDTLFENYNEKNIKGKREKLLSVSNSLLTWKNSFSDSNKYHYNREHYINDIIEWINSDNSIVNEKTKNPNVAVVVGEAGVGKTVILVDLLKRLVDLNFFVLGIKADLYQVTSLDELSKSMGLEDIIKFIDEINREEKIVIIIDQIDSLSLSMSKDRSVINFYYNFISRLSSFSNVKIIVSTRNFDLEYDPVIRNLKDNFNIKITDLDDNDLNTILSNMKINIPKESKLYKLLTRPLHIEILSQISVDHNLYDISSLTELYFKLWENKISSNCNSKEIILTLKYIISDMDSNGTLFISEKKIIDKKVGKDILLSESFLRKDLNSDKLQFFHASFFDFCFAKFFVEDNKSIYKFLLNQSHQGLSLRSQVKSVMQYLHEYDNKKYNEEFCKIINDTYIKYHLKLLLINQLGSFEDISGNDKKSSVNFLNNLEGFKYDFLLSVKTISWFHFLLENKYLDKYINETNKTLNNYVISLLYIFIHKDQENSLDFVIANKIKDKNYLQSILFEIEDWNSNKKQPYIIFNSLNEQLNVNEKINLLLLDRISKYNPNFICNYIFNKLNAYINEIDISQTTSNYFTYDDVETIKKLLEVHKIETITSSMILIEKLIEKTKFYFKENRIYFADSAFYCYDKSTLDLYNQFKILTMLIDNVLTLDIISFSQIFEKYFDTTYSTILFVFFSYFENNPDFFMEKIYSYIIKDKFLEEITLNKNLQYLVQTSLTELFEKFDYSQREKILDAIMKINPSWEKKETGFSSEGFTKFEYLKAIPENLLSNYKEIYKKFTDLNKKFYSYEIKEPESITGGWVGPPLSQEEYSSKIFDEWLFSFKKYKDNNFIDGGALEHARAFEKEITNKPDKFYQFIYDLGNNNEINIIYFYHGIDGLVKAKYDIDKVKAIILNFGYIKDNEFRRRIIWAIEYIDKLKTIDDEILNILEDYAINDPDPEKEEWRKENEDDIVLYGGSPITEGINSIRGSAVWALGIHAHRTNNPERLFKIFNKVVLDLSVSVRCCLSIYLPNMIKHDREKTIKILFKLIESDELHIISNCLQCIQCIASNDNFTKFIPYLQKIIKFKNIDSTDLIFGELITFFYINEYPESDILFKDTYEKNPVNIQGILSFIRQVISENYYRLEKLKDIFLLFIDREEEDIIKSYDFFFIDISIGIFENIFDMLVKYLKSKIFKSSKNSFFFEYLSKCVSLYPEKCIELMDIYSKVKREPNEQYIYGDDDKIRLLIESYNRTTDKNYKETAINIFDNLLQNREGQYFLKKVLEENDRN